MNAQLKTASILFLLSCFASPPVTAADGLTAGALYSSCVSADQAELNACRFYVLGLVQGVGLGDGTYLDATRKLVERKKTILCPPDNTPQAQIVAIAKDSLQQLFAVHPDDKKMPAATTVLGVMILKFPCPN
jgi:Rap1a immunity proteins